MPTSHAKRHHFIPQLTLNGFTGKADVVYQLDVRTGKPQKTSAYAAGSRHRFYQFEDDDGNKSNVVEAYCSLVESHAAPALRKLDETSEVTDIDRATIAFFLSLLWARTPGARANAERLKQDSSKLFMASHYGDPRTFKRMYRQWEAKHGEGDPLSETEMEDLRKKSLREFQEDKLRLTEGDGGYVTATLLEIALQSCDLMYGGMSWTLMRAPDDGEFITSDRGLAVFDPTPRFPWSGHALASSPNSQTTIPISSSSCLLLVPTGEADFEVSDLNRVEVESINLRTYGWADRYIYSSSQEMVADVRRAARKKPEQVTRPKPHSGVMLVERDPSDTWLAEAHIKRGWPPYLQAPDDDGTMRQFDYMVVGEDGDPVEVGVKTTEMAKGRAMKATV